MKSKLLDLFDNIGALRIRPEVEILQLFDEAFAEAPMLAIKIAFYARNIRGGLGERRTFRTILTHLAKNHPELLAKNLDAIALLGRYDDFYALIDTPVEQEMWDYLKKQLNTDLQHLSQNEPVSLLAKWLKSINASSPETNRLGKLTAQKLGFSQKAYRQTLAKLRHYEKVTEVHMSKGQWTDITYSKVPNKAMTLYQSAFKTHDHIRFSQYLTSQNTPSNPASSKPLFPYEILEKAPLTLQNHRFTFTTNSPLLEAQWEALPNYIDHNVLVMADTSGSMHGRPLCTALALTLYFAQQNQGAFHDVFMTFSSTPSLIRLKGETLTEKVAHIPSIVSTANLEAAFDLILKVATCNHLSKEELPKSLLVITDSDFDPACMQLEPCKFHQHFHKKYALHGYQLPTLIFWNVQSQQDVFQSVSSYPGIQLISGHAPHLFKTLLHHMGKSPYEAMLDVLNDPVYNCLHL